MGRVKKREVRRRIETLLCRARLLHGAELVGGDDEDKSPVNQLRGQASFEAPRLAEA